MNSFMSMLSHWCSSLRNKFTETVQAEFKGENESVAYHFFSLENVLQVDSLDNQLFKDGVVLKEGKSSFHFCFYSSKNAVVFPANHIRVYQAVF